MSKRRLKLIAARIESGIKTHDEMVNRLREIGIEITAESYGNVETGRNKNVDVVLAFAISCVVNKPVTRIFLSEAMQKMHQVNMIDYGPPAA